MVQFLPKETVNDPNALDKIFTEMHEAYQKRKVPMTEEQTKYSITVLMSSNERLKGIYNDLSKTFPIGGFFKRCTIFPIKYENKLLVWLGLTTMQFGIGGMILIAYYLQWWVVKQAEKQITVKNEIEIGPLTLDTVVEKCFPFGVFGEELIHEFWDKQKVAARPDNLVDHPSAAISFMPNTELEPIVP